MTETPLQRNAREAFGHALAAYRANGNRLTNGKPFIEAHKSFAITAFEEGAVTVGEIHRSVRWLSDALNLLTGK
ncbi:hypothetical protein GCM10010266_53180 [Streptomyces griseomycini]|uniref:hypothetical protein n=1 Tax=Streptomyces griseomycini TaxID=66895 RepID=UPI0018742990|nr:hypothetical protein [Streptomyces griseomycini]GGQ23295.1 hypothetical protein GCM10010266_53180 [Streptomyces griseomycini]